MGANYTIVKARMKGKAIDWHDHRSLQRVQTRLKRAHDSIPINWTGLRGRLCMRIHEIFNAG